MTNETKSGAGQNPSKDTASRGESDINSKAKTLNWIRIIVAILGICLVAFFFLLPALFILLSTMWPTVFPGSSVLVVLSDNVNKVIGVISVILGGISIYLAVKTDKVFQDQKHQQATFMEHIEDYTRNMRDSIDRFIYDGTKDKTGTNIQEPSSSGEE